MDAAGYVAQIHGSAAFELLEVGYSQVWQHEELFGGGAFCHFLPNQFEELYPAMQAAEGELSIHPLPPW
jgi:monoamine oxidase